MTWGIPDEYGGMTAAMLRRSRQLVRRERVDVDVVTIEDRPDTSELERRLRADGALIDGMRLRGIYAHFRAAERPAREVAHRVGPPDRAPDEERIGADGAVRWWREDGESVRIEHLRSDGTVAVVDERRPGRRLITALDAHGQPTGQWTSANAFRFAWLDELIGDGDAVAIVDSKTSARFMHRYRRPSVTLIHVVHGAHHDADGALSKARRPIFEALPSWDAVVFLTDRQRRDAIELVGDSGNTAVLPNSIALPEQPAATPAAHHGIVVARMTRIKRLDHALHVIARARELGVPVTAEFVGDGPERATLEAEAARCGLTEAVRFAGFVPGAAERMGDAAWTLLTSSSEGQSLMLLEAMAAGCVPIAYDIRYGPCELIDDGANGRLVPDGDVEAAAEALVELCRNDDARATMRRNARSTAERFDDDVISERWSEVIADAVRRHGERPPPAPPRPRPLVRRVLGRARRTARRLLSRLRNNR